MKNSTPIILAVGMVIASVALYAGAPYGRVVWAGEGKPEDVSESQPAPKPQYRMEDHLTKIKFELDDGTPCVMIFAPSSGPIRLAGPSIPGKAGVSCDWQYRKTE